MLLEIASLRVKWLALCSSGSFLMSSTTDICFTWKTRFSRGLFFSVLSHTLFCLKLYFRLMNLILIHIGVVFFSFSSRLVSLLPIVLIWFLFELILSYFGSDNWIWIRNLKLKTIVIKKKRKETYQIGPVWSTLVHFGPFNLLCSLPSNLVHFGSLWSNSVYFGLFSPFGPHLSNSVYSVHSVHFGPFGLIRCTYLRMKKDKFWLRVLSIIWVISIVIMRYVLVIIIISLRKWEFE